ncbi:MAG TPA: Clp protease N-terminal domain-containing protein [Candidatus Elarobacter sp.]|jgi:ATP-dependent Clp protease ATP-binding subunit ClpA
MTMWEPFSEPARRAIVRAQEVAQMFGANFIGNEHMVFALAEADDAVGAALTNAVDRDALREQLGNVSQAPVVEMVFTTAAKQSIELAFENARKLNHNYIGTAHVALGILSSAQPPPLLRDHDADSLRLALVLAATHDSPEAAQRKQRWKRSEATERHPVSDAVDSMLPYLKDLGKDGTRITVTLAVPGETERSWNWVKEPPA